MKILPSILSALLFAACGSSDPKTLIREGQAAQGAGNSELAQAKFNAALKDLTPGEQVYIDAKMGLVVALIATQPKKAEADLLALADDYPRMVGEKELVYVVSQMVSAHKYQEALELVQTGTQRAGGESPKLQQQVERVRKAAATDSQAANALDSLGYK